GRHLLAMVNVPKPAAEQAYDAWLGMPDEKGRGTALVFSFAGTFANAAMSNAANHRARPLDSAVGAVLRDLVVREIAVPGAVALADEHRKNARERYEADWAPACLPGEWLGAG